MFRFDTGDDGLVGNLRWRPGIRSQPLFANAATAVVEAADADIQHGASTRNGDAGKLGVFQAVLDEGVSHLRPVVVRYTAYFLGGAPPAETGQGRPSGG